MVAGRCCALFGAWLGTTQPFALSPCSAHADGRFVDVVGIITSGPVAFRKHAPGLTHRGVSASARRAKPEYGLAYGRHRNMTEP